MSVTAVGGGDEVPVSEDAADADTDRLLADAQVDGTEDLASQEQGAGGLLERPDTAHRPVQLDACVGGRSVGEQRRIGRPADRSSVHLSHLSSAESIVSHGGGGGKDAPAR